MNALFETCICQVSSALQQVKDSARNAISQPEDDAMIETIGPKIGVAAEGCSFEATKLSMLFSTKERPSIEEATGVLQSVEKIVENIVTPFCSLPLSKGKYYRKSLEKGLVNILDGLLKTLEAIRKNGFFCDSTELQKTGLVWEACDAFMQIPSDNQQVVVNLLENETDLMADAIEEAEESMNNQIYATLDMEDDESDGMSSSLTEAEKQIVISLLSLMKCSHLCLKKTKKLVQSPCFQSSSAQYELDSIADRALTLSERIDELVLILEPPLDGSLVKEQVQLLSSTVLDMLSMLAGCSMCPTEEIEKLEKFKSGLEKQKIKSLELLC